MAETWVKKPVEWTIKDVGAPLLDSLAGGLYSKLEVFREYVQNAVDSYADFERETGRTPQNTVQVWVDSDNAALHIQDDGIGMDWEDIKTAKAIAVSPKLVRYNEFVGFRGLGIWSGLSACEQLVLTTTKIGIPYEYQLVIDCKGIVERYQDPIPIDDLLRDRLEILERPGDTNDHFTQVKLVNIHSDRFRELLDVRALTRYAEQNLPVPFDPGWKSAALLNDDPSQRPYVEIVNEILQDVPWTANYVLTINGEQVYRRIQPVSEIKPPERHVISDEAGQPVAIAWLCETNRRGSKKALEISSDKNWVRSFAIRVKNFTIGERGLYTERGLYSDQDVMDPGNLDWFVGEIYIIDDGIKPDTKRTRFQPSPRQDAVITALRKFYTSTALRARGWSAQVNTEEDCEHVKEAVARVEEIFDDNSLSYKQKAEQLRPLITDLEKRWLELQTVREEANKPDTWTPDGERARIIRGYLRKKGVQQAIASAMGMITTIKNRLEQFTPPSASSEPHSSVPDLRPLTLTLDVAKAPASARSRRSKARTNRLKGEQISTSDALSTQVVTGILPTALPGLEAFVEANERKKEIEANKEPSTEIITAIEAFRATVAAVVGEGSEIYWKIMKQLREELRRRGLNINA